MLQNMHSCCMELLYCFTDLVYILVVSFVGGTGLKDESIFNVKEKNIVAMQPSHTIVPQNCWILRHHTRVLAPQRDVRSCFYEIS
jgi:hypothetical protein